jgi:hypothetical protein
MSSIAAAFLFLLFPAWARFFRKILKEIGHLSPFARSLLLLYWN